jgi:hypothetical protein
MADRTVSSVAQSRSVQKRRKECTERCDAPATEALTM